MKKYYGHTVNKGMEIADIYRIYSSKIIIQKQIVQDAEAQKERLDKAVETVISNLEQSKNQIKLNHGLDGIDIINTHIMLLNDTSKESLISKAKMMITEDKVSAEYALCNVSDAMVKEFVKEPKSQYLSARSEDIIHIKNMLTDCLLGVWHQQDIFKPSLIIADELSPEQLTAIEPQFIKGIVTSKGSPLSHTAILAKNMNIPFLTGVNFDINNISDGVMGIIDTSDEIFIYNPEEKILKEYEDKLNQTEAKKALQKEKAKELVAKSPITLCANIGRPTEVITAVDNCAAGIGLFRSEFLYMDTDEVPDEGIQFEAYVKVLDAMNGKPVIVRTIDIGADKGAKCISLPAESNPALGTRGIRISFANPKIFETQLRALLRASYQRNLKIMFPMISSLWEVQKAVDAVNAVAKSLEEEGIEYSIPPLGIMVETPAAALILDDIAPLIDFVSIGTNDLTQYTIALDRVNDGLMEYYDPHHKAVLSLVELTADKAHKHGLTVGICGELGSDINLAEEFLNMGIDELSMSPGKIPAMAEKLCAMVPANSVVTAPVDGYIIPMEEIPDPVFANGLVGECVGIYPDNGVVVSPIDGIVTMIAKTKHAITIKGNNTAAILIHVGIDTVNMNGRGFELKISEGAKVCTGDELLTFDIDAIKDAGYCPVVIVVKLPK